MFASTTCRSSPALQRRDDLKFFLKEVCGMDYVHTPDLAPTQEMLDEYKKLKGDWQTYEKRFLDLMEKLRKNRRADTEGSCCRRVPAL